MIDAIVAEGCDMYTDLVAESDEKYRSLCEEGGVTVTSIDDYTPWIEAVQPVYEKWEAILDKDLIEEVRSLGWD